ncbi:non-motor actin binding protein [Lithospermum erythrorhizon]|uniref:Non-motor actin binding protein n=1 Tax=Lithospermum erythrorhizon TaxID=34254 RepID=A0AAV3PJG8_LITER
MAIVRGGLRRASRNQKNRENKILRSEDEHNRENIISLQERVKKLREEENKTVDDDECHHLRKENEELMKKVELLHADRCSDAEEMVYLRWINAWLSYELRNYQPSPRRTIARDLSKTLSPRSEEIAKQFILQYGSAEGMGDKSRNLIQYDHGALPSSQNSDVTDCGEHSSTDILLPTKSKAKEFDKG